MSADGLLARIKADLPRFPEEVIRDWLVPFATVEGWPPPVDVRGVPTGRWQLLLMSRPLKYWQDLTWTMSSVAMSLQVLSVRSRNAILGMHDAYLKGVENEYSTIKNGPDRMFSSMIFLSDNARLPVPPTLVADPDGLTIIDGNHRVAAYITYVDMWANSMIPSQIGQDSVAPPSDIACWVGRDTPLS